MGPPAIFPLESFSRYLWDKVTSTILVVIPKKADINIQKSAPAPPKNEMAGCHIRIRNRSLLFRNRLPSPDKQHLECNVLLLQYKSHTHRRDIDGSLRIHHHRRPKTNSKSIGKNRSGYGYRLFYRSYQRYRLQL